MNMYVYNKDIYVLTFTNKIILYKMTFILTFRCSKQELFVLTSSCQEDAIMYYVNILFD